MMKLGQMASMQRCRKFPACTVKIAVHMSATKARMQMAGNEPYIPKTLRMRTGKGRAYVAPILPVSVITTLQIAKPKKTIGIVSLAVNPRAMTALTVEAKGGANISEHLVVTSMAVTDVSSRVCSPICPVIHSSPRPLLRRYWIKIFVGPTRCILATLKRDPQSEVGSKACF